MHDDPLIARFRDGFPRGFSRITSEDDAPAGSGMDFGIHVLARGETIVERHPKETCWVLLDGSVEVDVDGSHTVATRHSLFDEAPTAFHVAAATPVTIGARGDRAELAVVRVANARRFPARCYSPDDVELEQRGAGLAQEACLREVRLIFDDRTRPESNLVVGEVVSRAGRWSSYPPHHHPQPEIYHYRFSLPQGYGHAEMGERVFKVKQRDTLLIAGGHDHAQAAAPGYAMYYLWIVRHLEAERYTGFEMTPEHAWLLDPNAQGWEPRR